MGGQLEPVLEQHNMFVYICVASVLLHVQYANSFLSRLFTN